MITLKGSGPSNTLTLVQAFAPYRDMVARHLPLWLRHAGRVVISSPRDSFCAIPGVMCVAHGEEGHAGPKSLDRWKEILWWLSEQPEDFFLMHESDSVCLSDGVPSPLYQEPGVFFSNEIMDNAVPPTQEVFCVAPWFFSKEVLKKFLVVAASEAYRPPYHGDRWVGQVLQNGGIPHRLFSPGIACGTLLPGSPDLDQVCEVVRSGASMIHGVKSLEVLERLLLEARSGFTIKQGQVTWVERHL